VALCGDAPINERCATAFRNARRVGSWDGCGHPPSASRRVTWWDAGRWRISRLGSNFVANKALVAKIPSFAHCRPQRSASHSIAKFCGAGFTRRVVCLVRFGYLWSSISKANPLHWFFGRRRSGLYGSVSRRLCFSCDLSHWGYLASIWVCGPYFSPY
jgi:hypothetical protein